MLRNPHHILLSHQKISFLPAQKGARASGPSPAGLICTALAIDIYPGPKQFSVRCRLTRYPWRRCKEDPSSGYLHR